MQHRIRKQVMDLTINGRLDAFRTQHLAGPFFYRQLLPALEKIFDELSDDHQTISLDILQLDLGIIPVQDLEDMTWNNEWETILREQVNTALREQGKNANPQRVSAKANSCRQWLFYMEHGYLNWNAAGFGEKELPAVLEMLATDFSLVQTLRKLLQNNQQALIRIVRGHDENFLISLIEILTATTQRDLLQAVNELIQLHSTLKSESSSAPIDAKQLRQQAWISVMQVTANEKPGLQTGMLVKQILITDEALPSITIGRLNQFQSLKIIYPVLKTVQVRQQMQDKKQHFEKEIGQQNQKVKTKRDETLQPDIIDENGIYISHAGIVLLHPFLSTFFNRLELTANGKFHNTAAAEKAVHLLHFLATGRTGSEEHELAIPKLLCELPLQYALKEIIELTDKERQEADNLLAAAIDQWEKLKSISIDALRENFLQRGGKLYTKNDLRYLQVEHGSLDVLLDYLPWTLSIVKLPWMKEMLRIEWR
jgi:hypothetical protein